MMSRKKFWFDIILIKKNSETRKNSVSIKILVEKNSGLKNQSRKKIRVEKIRSGKKLWVEKNISQKKLRLNGFRRV